VIKADAVSKVLRGEPLFAGFSATINAGEHLGIVGPNGVGKTTLLRVLAGDEAPTTGHVQHSAGDVIRVFAQDRSLPDRLDEHIASGLGDAWSLHQRLGVLAAQMAGGGTDALAEYGRVQERFDAIDGWTQIARIDEVKQQLGLADIPAGALVTRLSGGQQARASLARSLVAGPTFLLLDEPTNHLDLEGITWLTGYLQASALGIVLVSYDRALLDAVCHRIAELDGLDPEPHWYTGGYTAYREERRQRLHRLALDYEAQKKQQKRIEADIASTKARAISMEHSSHSAALRVKAKGVAKRAKSRERKLDLLMRSVQWVERPQERPRLSVATAAAASSGTLTAEDLCISYGTSVILADVSLTFRPTDRVLITGPNGSGKTSLLRVLAGQLEPARGKVHGTESAGLLEQTADGLPMEMIMMDYFRREVPSYVEDAQEILTGYLFDYDEWSHPIKYLSAGQQRRLQLAVLFSTPRNYLLLDEPTNFLDFDSLDVIESALDEHKGALLVATHDRFFAERLRANITVSVGDGAVRVSQSE
jgi:ATPase subunit of ABC transporter with duplicated ATPase domains